MKDDKRKIAVVGTGMVGMSYAYALLNQAVCDELLLIDIDKERAKGEAMDLNHGLAFAPSSMKIYHGDYSDCSDADLVVLCAGVAQKPDETRLNLLQRNADVFKTIVPPIIQSGFSGIFLTATNPVDIMTRVVYELSGFEPSKIIGSGTTLDTARLRYLMGEYFEVDPRNVHAYVIGEHGDSEFVPFSQALIATKPVLEICSDYDNCSLAELESISEKVRTSANVIIKAKKATYYGIGMALTRITKAIFGNENSVLTITSKANGIYGLPDNVFLGLPCFVNRSGAKKILRLNLSDSEIQKLSASAKTLDEYFSQLKL